MNDERSPRPFAHVGLTVPDLTAAIEWYEDVFDWSVLKRPQSSTAHEGYAGKRAVDLLGDYGTMRVAHLRTGNGIGVELFEFEDTEGPTDPVPSRPGLFHVCVVDPDVEGLAATVDRRGGDHYADVWQLYEDTDEYRLTYCRDPFGNLIEIYSHDHDEMHAGDRETE